MTRLLLTNSERMLYNFTTLHCLFRCQHCALTIWLPHKSLGHMFGNQELRTIHAPAAIVVCPYCKQVQTCRYQEATDAEHLASDRAVYLPHSVDTVLAGWLQCEKEECRTPLPLFVQWSETTTEEEREADIKTWVWDGLRCPAGHSIAQPKA